MPTAALPFAAVAASLALVAMSPFVLLAVTVGAGLTRVAVLRRRRDRFRVQVERAMPDVIDLFVVAASAGVPVSGCLPLVAPRAPPAVRPVLERSVSAIRRGAPVRAALEEMAAGLGGAGGELVRALDDAAHTGAPLGPALRLVAADARHRQARAAEERARRLPVTLLFPLVCCTLPAAGLLALVPVIVASLGSLAR